MKVVKNSLIWLACIFLSFTTIFTISVLYEGSGFEGIYYMLNEKMEQELKGEGINEIAKGQNEWITSFFENNDESEINWKEAYNQYPGGTVYTMTQIAYMQGIGECTITSLVLGVIVGTSIFLLIVTKKKGIIITMVIYGISVIVLGFLQGIQDVSGDHLKLLDYWIFPEEYIVPVTILFGAVIVLIIVRKKEIAKKLNEKLKEKKNK